ncbi:UNVERIFIED_CONTAM: hypothetical protein Slati_4506400 [Sesamum latifolium]|uniref:Retrotransposon gag domain-containing protein n=1 Tax=Sesamum latifolium TaxID=2727402 RepID=A0AAW2SSI1_9LAMI
MVELRQQVAKETLLAERGIPFSGHIMTDELPAYFLAPSHLRAYNAPVSKKYRNSAISFFGIKQEEKETLRTYVQRFNTAILEVITAHQEVLVSAFTQGLQGGTLFESLAKKPAIDVLDVLAKAENT